jgi:hypothetical protein
MRNLIICTLMASLVCLSANRLSAQNLTPSYTQWYAGGMAGATVIGWDQIPSTIGLHGAYFFNQKYGAGLVVRKCGYIADELVVAPAFFAHWGRSNSKLFFPTRIGVGVEMTQRYPAVYASAGIAYRALKLISFGVNADFASSFENDIEDVLGFNIGISFHF